VEFSRRLGAPGTLGDLLEAVAREAERIAGRPACVLMPLPPAPGQAEPEPVLRAAIPIDAEPDDAAMAAARWAMAHGRPTGRGTDTLPAGTAWQFRPMRTARGLVGLVGLRLGEVVRLEPETDRSLAALLDQAAVAIERIELVEAAARDAARAETEQLRLALLTSLGHDLRTPLTSIRGALGALRLPGEALAPAVREDLLATAEEETVRLTRTLANILDIVRLENGQVEPRREPVDLVEAVEAAAGRLERATGRRIARRFDPRLPAPRLDPALLDQVLGNLLDNALKFSGVGGEVSVTVRREGHEVAVAIEDSGPGIPAEALGRVFDPFFRASRTDRIVAGTGLGLAIARGLTVAMGGRVGAESPVVAGGQGTRVTLRFPA
jgi:two-component system, OmpR family, sensor histidine kinase KdpD